MKNKIPLKKKLDEGFKGLLTKTLPTKADDQQTVLFKKTAYVVIGMFFLTFFLAGAVFLFTLKGQEETMVPKVVGEDLVTAIQELQDKELIPQVQVKFSTNPQEKGSVVGQDPQGGILVKAGRRITLWVSKGAVIDKVENYVGQNINDVQLHLKSLFATQGQTLIKIQEDPVYAYNSAPEGTILEQRPTPGTPISNSVELQVVISRGPKGQMVHVGSYTGLDYKTALNQLSAQNMPFLFKTRLAAGNELPGTVVSQNPTPDADIPKGTPVNLVMATPSKPEAGQIFGLFEATLPDYPILVDLKVEIKKVNGDKVPLLAMKHPGGPFAVPYVASPGDTLVLSILDKEILTQQVGQ